MQTIPFNSRMTADFFTESGKPALSLKIRQKNSNISTLLPCEVKAFLQALPFGSYQYVIINKKDASSRSSLYLKVGRANHALVALSDAQALQSSDRQMFNAIIQTINVVAAGDIHKIADSCYLTDQSGGYHHVELTREYYLLHQKLLAIMSLLSYPFHYFSAIHSCEKIMRVLSSDQLQLMMYHQHRVTLYRVFEKIAALHDASLRKCLEGTLNTSMVSSVAKKVLSSRQVAYTLPNHNLFQESLVGLELSIKAPKRPIKAPSRAPFFRHERHHSTSSQSDQLSSRTSECARM